MISIIMPTFNKADYLELTLASFTLQDNTDFELIVINDGCEDHTDAVVKKYDDKLNIKYIQQSNRGRAAARNAGIRHAEGDIIIFNDDDRMVHPQFLSEHLQELTKDERVAVIGWKKSILTIWKKNRLRLSKQSFYPLMARNPDTINKINNTDVLQLVYPEDVKHNFHDLIAKYSLPEADATENCKELIDAFSDDLTDFRLSWMIATTANMSVHSAYVKKINGFDESYVGWGMEDTDLNYRLHLEGIRFKSCRTAVNFHQIHPLGESQVKQDIRQRDLQWYQNVVRFCEKYDNLEAFVFWNLCRRKPLNFVSANKLLQKLHSLDDCVLNELLTTYRELFALCEHAS